MTASYQNQKFLIDGKYYSYEQLIPPIEEPNIASKIKSFLFSALKPIKEAPLQGLSGLWGGVQGSLMSGSSGGDPGEARWVTANSYQWEMPEGVTSVSVVCVGAGGAGCADEYEGGGGGGLAYMNNFSVTAGNQYAVSVGAGGIQQTVNQNPQNNGGDSWFNQSGTCRGVGGQSGETNRGGGSGGGGVCPSGVTRQGGDGGGREESAGSSSGGGGAAGYAGNGGRGGDGDYPESPTQANTAGAGGGGGGGLYGSDQFPGMAREDQGGGGGGTGIYGQGPNGGAGTNAQFGGGGIGGSPANSTGNPGIGIPTGQPELNPYGGQFGGGGGCNDQYGGTGGLGAVRVVWPGDSRQFPTTDVALADSTGDIWIDNVKQ